jgi:hypothetical protein
MRENRWKRNQISEMSFPRYEKTNKIYIYMYIQETKYMQISGYCLGADETFVPMGCYRACIGSC